MSDAETAMQREPGYYWTRSVGGEWVVAEWAGEQWFFPGSSRPQRNDPTEVVEEMLPEPEE